MAATSAAMTTGEDEDEMLDAGRFPSFLSKKKNPSAM
jgi:hypothetical protein